MYHQPPPAAPGAAASQARPLKASHASSPSPFLSPAGNKALAQLQIFILEEAKFKPAAPEEPWTAPWAKDIHRHDVLSNQSGQSVGARWGTSNPRVCPRIPAQNTAKSSIQSPDDVSIFTTRCEELMKLSLPSGKRGWALTTAAQWQAATAQPCAYRPVSGQWHRLF